MAPCSWRMFQVPARFTVPAVQCGSHVLWPRRSGGLEGRQQHRRTHLDLATYRGSNPEPGTPVPPTVEGGLRFPLCQLSYRSACPTSGHDSSGRIAWSRLELNQLLRFRRRVSHPLQDLVPEGGAATCRGDPFPACSPPSGGRSWCYRMSPTPRPGSRAGYSTPTSLHLSLFGWSPARCPGRAMRGADGSRTRVPGTCWSKSPARSGMPRSPSASTRLAPCRLITPAVRLVHWLSRQGYRLAARWCRVVGRASKRSLRCAPDQQL